MNRPFRVGLLATGSALAMMVASEGAAFAAACTFQNNNGVAGNLTISAPADCVTYFDATNHVVNVINNSTLTPTGTGFAPGTGTGISVVKQGTTLTGNIINNGTINASHKLGINIGEGATSSTHSNAGAVLNGSITNTSTINASQGIVVSGNPTLFSTMTGSIINTVGGQINFTNAGINVQLATVGGSITNAGTLSGATGTAGIGVNYGTTLGSSATPGSGNIVNATGAKIVSGFLGISVNGNFSQASVPAVTIAGSVINNGTIITPNVTTHAGIVVDAAVVQGGITNGGTLSGGQGIVLFGATDHGISRGVSVAGSIVNQNKIIVSVTGGAVQGIALFAGSHTTTGPALVGGSVINSGTISVTGVSGGTASGILLQGAHVAGGITNMSTVSVSGGTVNVGIKVVRSASAASPVNSSVGGSVVNQGSITAGTGVLVNGGSTIGGNISNTSGGTITTALNGIMVDGGSAVNGSIINSAAINSAFNGIIVTGSSNVTGSIVNATGATIHISGVTVGGGGISVFIATAGGITNNGTITANAFYPLTPIEASEATINGNIVNGMKGTISGDATGAIQIINGGVINGSIQNFGVINAVDTNASIPAGTPNVAAGIYIFPNASAGNVTRGQTITGNVLNAGTINAGFGIEVFATNNTAPAALAVIQGNVVNSGTINAARSGIVIGSATVGGAVRNSGTITAAQDGIQLFNLATAVASTGATFTGHAGPASVVGQVVNSGTITSTGTGFAGIALAGATVGGITNALGGSISAAKGAGILIGNTGLITFTNGTNFTVASGASSVKGGVNNQGTISAMTGIMVTGGGVVNGGITNSGDITGSTAAIDVRNEGAATAINQMGGTITGAILLSTLGDTVNVTGGAIKGNIVGQGSNSTLNFALGAGTFTYTNSFTGINQANFNSGTVVLEGADTVSHVAINGGTVVVGNDLAFGTAPIAMAAGTTLSFLNANFSISNPITITGDPNFTPPAGTTQTLAGVISGTGTLNMNGAGTLVLSAINTYTGPTDVNSGILDVSGSIASSSAVNVASGGTLTGTGNLGPVTVASGGKFAPGTIGAPGTSSNLSSLAFQSGAAYVIYLNPATSTFANVSGTASLKGTVQANFAAGSYVFKQYTILTAAGGVSGTFAGISNIGLPAGFADSLSYSANNVFLNLAPGFTQFTGLNTNQQNVANALTNFFNTTGSIPSRFANLTPAGLTQLDGENATGAERASYDLMNEFLNLMLDPFVDGRGGYPAGGGATPLGFAPDQLASLPPDIALAYAGVFKAPPPAPVTFDQRWTSWAAGFGGRANANGDPAVGSNNVTTSTFGYAAGTDYHFSPNSVLGFSLAGGGTNWNLANALGTGRSNAFLAGVYGVTHAGPVYLAAALAFANNWFTTNRGAMGDVLTANFQGQNYAGRLEAGYRYTVPAAYNLIGLTPYAAIQAQDFHTPGYSETDLSGGGFGLSYNAMNGTDTRSELGGRFDDLTAVAAMPVILRARIAWAHDWVSNPALNASFQSLPGTSFTVFGAPIPQDSALASAGAQFFFTPNWSFLAKFDGEFASGSQVYAGSGTLRYTW